MNLWRLAGGLFLVGAVALGVTAYGQQPGDKDKPVWKGFDNDKPFWQEMTTETNQTMTVQGQQVKQDQKQTFWVMWTVKEKGTNTWKVEYKIVGVKMNIQIGGNNISYDSTDLKNPPPNNPLTDFFKALVGSDFTLTVTNDPKTGLTVSDIDQSKLDAFVNKLSAANEQLKPLLKSILDKEAIKQMSNPTFAAFPKSDADWTKGSWEYKVLLSMGPIGSYNTTYTYTKGKDSNKIDVKAKITVATK